MASSDSQIDKPQRGRPKLKSFYGFAMTFKNKISINQSWYKKALPLTNNSIVSVAVLIKFALSNIRETSLVNPQNSIAALQRCAACDVCCRPRDLCWISKRLPPNPNAKPNTKPNPKKKKLRKETKKKGKRERTFRIRTPKLTIPSAITQPTVLIGNSFQSN